MGITEKFPHQEPEDTEDVSENKAFKLQHKENQKEASHLVCACNRTWSNGDEGPPLAPLKLK